MSDEKKKTILILANFSTGLYDFRAELLSRLVEEDYRVVCAVPDDVKEGELRALGCETMLTPMSRRGMNPFEDWALYRNYCRILREIKPDLALTYTVKPNVYGGMACRALKIPYISTVTGLGTSLMGKGLLKRLVTLLYRRGAKDAECLFFENDANKAAFSDLKIKAKKTRLVGGAGVNLQKYHLEPYPSGDSFIFLFVGRIMREKGIEEFIEAAKALSSDHARFQVLGFCEEDYQEWLDQLEASGIIEQLGFSPDVRKYYRSASAVVLPTYHEGLSNVLLEASAMGRPVIATDIPGCRETFDENETGLGIAPRDSDSLIAALVRFMAIPEADRALMGRKAREKIGREFNREDVVRANMEEIEAALRQIND